MWIFKVKDGLKILHLRLAKKELEEELARVKESLDQLSSTRDSDTSALQSVKDEVCDHRSVPRFFLMDFCSSLPRKLRIPPKQH